jgi:hypothetical protein
VPLGRAAIEGGICALDHLACTLACGPEEAEVVSDAHHWSSALAAQLLDPLDLHGPTEAIETDQAIFKAIGTDHL